MTNTATVTRHDNGNGTYRYEIVELPDFLMKASRTLYTHASVFPHEHGPIVNFHRTLDAALRKASTDGTVVTITEA